MTDLDTAREAARAYLRQTTGDAAGPHEWLEDAPITCKRCKAQLGET